MKRPSQRGFTLVELMITTVIVGVLSTVAIPTFQRFITKARTAEAPTNIQAIGHGILNYYNRERLDANGLVERPHFPRCGGTAAAPTRCTFAVTRRPNANPCSNTTNVSRSGSPKYLRNPNNWTAVPWPDIGFSIPEAHYFNYQYEGPTNDPTCTVAGCYNYWIQARADMDCDGTLSDYRQQGVRDQATGEIVRGGIVHFANPEE